MRHRLYNDKYVFIVCGVGSVSLLNLQNFINKNMALKNFELYKQGAEAKIHIGTYLGKATLAKERFFKKYRHSELDQFITKERMKAECRAIVRCKSAGIRTPTIYLVDYKRRVILLEYFENNICLKDYIENLSDEKSLVELSVRIGNLIGKMHLKNIIHGDLTSSNILLVKKDKAGKQNLENMDLVLIDFGLAHVDSSAEDKGVDLYVLERALLSTHSVASEMFENILQGYKNVTHNSFKEMFTKYEEIRARGRKRTMVG